jgi:hypothetical protein
MRWARASDSGCKLGKCRTQGRRARVRSVLYMAALSASRFNPIICAFYENLVKRGKEHKVALIEYHGQEQDAPWRDAGKQPELLTFITVVLRRIFPRRRISSTVD